MLERYFVRPDTIDRVRSSWIGGPIKRYVEWLTEHGYTSQTILRRVPLLMQFGAFARQHGAMKWEELVGYIEEFALHWVKKHGRGCKTDQARKKVEEEARNPVEQMLSLVIPDFKDKGRSRAYELFQDRAPGFFDYLQKERGLRERTLFHYRGHLRSFERYLQKIGLRKLHALSPVILSAFVTNGSDGLCKTSLKNRCAVLRVFLRYLYRERIVAKDLSSTLDSPHLYRLSSIPRSITWDEVYRMLEAVDRRTPVGKRDYAILLLLVTYGLRAREIAALTFR
jgi:hypothetical protein